MSKPQARTRGKELRKPLDARSSFPPVYPFAGIVGQDEMKLGLVLNVIDPSIGGVLMMGHRGTGKSTAVRALADLLPEIWIVRGCRFNCEPADSKHLCADCAEQLAADRKLQRERSAVPVIDLPLGATEDRVCGAIDIQRVLREGIKSFEPGLLARANRGFLYIDEVNLLEDHLVDLLLDVAITGRNRVERENISIEHPARFVLIGSGNPEEGELRPQLLDRFGLYIEVKTENEPGRRVEIVEKREAFERNAERFCASLENEQKQLRQKIARAGKSFANVKVDRPFLRQIATLCSELNVDGHRGELTIMRAARALAAFEGRKAVDERDVRRVATMSLRHRLRRDALADTPGSVQIEQALNKSFQSAKPAPGFDDESLSSPGNQGTSRERGAENSRSRRSSNQQGRNGSDSDREVAAPPTIDAKLSGLSLDNHSSARTATKAASRGRQAGLRRSSYNYQRGRYARGVSLKRIGARIALVATIRAAVCNGRDFSADDLLYKQFARKNGTLFIFAIDTSGSMALNRINQAKGALLHLLEQSYVNRDSVAIVAFQGTDAEVLLPPSRSIVRARRALDTLAIGGGTPLSAALACSLELARRATLQRRGEILLLLFTDGHANVPLTANVPDDRISRRQTIQREVKRFGAELASKAITVVVVDTNKRFAANSDTRAIAEMLGAKYLTI